MAVLSLGDRKELNVIYKAHGRACGALRTEIDLTLLQDDKPSEAFRLSTDGNAGRNALASGPSPLAHFAAALVGSLTMQLQLLARTMGIVMRDVTTDAILRCVGRQIDDTHSAVRLQSISIDFMIDSDAPEGELLRLLDLVKNSCIVEQSLSPDISISHRLKRQGGWVSL